jgi:hypothetical protein
MLSANATASVSWSWIDRTAHASGADGPATKLIARRKVRDHIVARARPSLLRVSP